MYAEWPLTACIFVADLSFSFKCHACKFPPDPPTKMCPEVGMNRHCVNPKLTVHGFHTRYHLRGGGGGLTKKKKKERSVRRRRITRGCRVSIL